MVGLCAQWVMSLFGVALKAFPFYGQPMEESGPPSAGAFLATTANMDYGSSVPIKVSGCGASPFETGMLSTAKIER